MRVEAIPCLKDNYAYLIVCEQTGKAAVVDPSEALPVRRCIEQLNVELVAILNTHHHWDHIGGNEALRMQNPQVRIYGHASDRGRIPGQSEFLSAASTVQIGNLRGSITHNPGHTSGAITYYFEDVAFTGDTLFAAGCGRLFEGTAPEMYDSLVHQIGRHPAETRLYFGHEYTENNLRFALSLEAENTAVQLKLEKVQKQRAFGQPSCPSTLGEEFATNPFLRCHQPSIIAAAQAAEPGCDGSPTSVFAAVRRLKDKF